jgi:integrase
MAWLWKRKDVWYVGYREDGKDKYLSTGTNNREEALTTKAEIELKLRVNNGTLDKTTSNDITISQLAQLYFASADIKPSTMTINKSSWAKFQRAVGDLKVATVTPESIKAFRTSLEASGAAPASISIHLRDVRKLLGFAVDRGIIDKNPCAKINLPEQHPVWRFITMEEEQRLLALANPMMRRVITAALETGLRISQLVELNWKQFNSREKILYIPAQKRQKARSIPVMPKALDALGTPKLSGQIFDGINKDMIEKMWGRLLKKARIHGRLRFHDLRHTAASRLSKILTPFELRDLFGWSSVALVDRYTHSRVEDIRAKLHKAL